MSFVPGATNNCLLAGLGKPLSKRVLAIHGNCYSLTEYCISSKILDPKFQNIGHGSLSRFIKLAPGVMVDQHESLANTTELHHNLFGNRTGI